MSYSYYSFNLKNEHSNIIEKNRNKTRNIFYSILCILLIQIMVTGITVMTGITRMIGMTRVTGMTRKTGMTR